LRGVGGLNSTLANMPGFAYQDGRKWRPTRISHLERYLSQFIRPSGNISDAQARGVKKNIAYSLQYLEFLAELDNDLELSDVLLTLNWKTFIIHGCAIIESLLHFALAASGVSRSRLKTMRFAEVCEQTASQNLGSLNKTCYDQLRELRELRNRVHISRPQGPLDTDYMKFNRSEYELMKSLLRSILTSDLFPARDESVDFQFLEASLGKSIAPLVFF
jgi:hypothetical protein